MKPRTTLKRRINRTFILQAAAISLAAVISVLLAAAIIQRVLVTEALRQEADYFWAQYAANPAFPPPDTRNLGSLLAPADGESALPERLRNLEDGFHTPPDAEEFSTVYVTSRDGQRLFLFFDGERVNELAAYFGLVPLAIVLLVLYLSVWFAFRASHRAVSPVAWLAREVNRLDPAGSGSRKFDLDGLPADAEEEVRVLAAALGGYVERLGAFVERERTFTRDASHELRTPLTVIRVATDILQDHPALTDDMRENIARIRRSAIDMAQLVDAFLLLAREADGSLPNASVCVNDIIETELDNLRLLAESKPVDLAVSARCRLTVTAPEQAVSAVIRNLLRNALSYTDAGRVGVEITPGKVSIEDSGKGMNEQELKAAFQPWFRGDPRQRGGHGVGLTIVKRFADRFGWTVGIESTPGVGTRVEVSFPAAHSDQL